MWDRFIKEAGFPSANPESSVLKPFSPDQEWQSTRFHCHHKVYGSAWTHAPCLPALSMLPRLHIISLVTGNTQFPSEKCTCRSGTTTVLQCLHSSLLDHTNNLAIQYQYLGFFLPSCGQRHLERGPVSVGHTHYTLHTIPPLYPYGRWGLVAHAVNLSALLFF